MIEFEIVDAPQFGRRSKNVEQHMELMSALLKVPPGKSIRLPFNDSKSQKSYRNSLFTYLKKQKLNKTYFIGKPTTADNGKFYVYIGRKSGE